MHIIWQTNVMPACGAGTPPAAAMSFAPATMRGSQPPPRASQVRARMRLRSDVLPFGRPSCRKCDGPSTISATGALSSKITLMSMLRSVCVHLSTAVIGHDEHNAQRSGASRSVSSTPSCGCSGAGPASSRAPRRAAPRRARAATVSVEGAHSFSADEALAKPLAKGACSSGAQRKPDGRLSPTQGASPWRTLRIARCRRSPLH